MAIYGGVDVMECLEMYEEEPEVTGREIGTLCNLNPTLDICAGMYSKFLFHSSKMT